MAVKNEHLQTQIKALSEKVSEAIGIMRDAAGTVIKHAADIADVKSEVEKQTALANQIHASHDSSIGRLTDIVEGNGKPGLKTDIAEVRGDIKLISNRLGWLIAILVALFVPIYGGAIGYTFGLLPMPSSSTSSTQEYRIVVVTATPSVAYYSFPATSPAPTPYPVALPTPTRIHGNNQ